MGSKLEEPAVPCLRVTQLDAHDLDEYFSQLLVRQQLDRCLKYFFPKFAGKIKPELQTLLYGTLLYYSLAKTHQTVGQKLFSVMLADAKTLGPTSSRKISSLIALEVFVYWWKARYNDVHPSFISSRAVLSKFLDTFIIATKVIEICNFLMFLRKGEFDRVFLRLLGLRVVFDHPNPVPSSVSYTILSREILWRGFAESTLYFLTFFDWARIRRYFRSKLRNFSGSEVEPDIRVCGFCEEWPTQPYQVNCGHVFCYYCAAAAVSSRSCCPLCESTLENLLGPKTVPLNEDQKKIV